MARDLSQGYIDLCQICSSANLETILQLGHHAPCDSLLTSEDLRREEVTFPLNLVRCYDCSLVQIDYVVAPETLFPNNYPYISGITDSLVTRLMRTSQAVISRFPQFKNSVCIDIGSNDGTLLKGFKGEGLEVMGVEPSNIAKIAESNGIPTLQSFFNIECAKTILSIHQKVDVVTATNMFAHMPNLDSFMNAIRTLLSPDGIFVTESHYLGSILQTLQYDSIYHEHLRFYSAESIRNYLQQYGFSIAAIEEIDNYGGSIRVYASKNGKLADKKNVTKFFKNEECNEINSLKSLIDFSDRVKISKHQISILLAELKAKNHQVPGIGCPGRAATLLNYIGIDQEMMPYIAEQETSLKIGKFLPGSHIPILDEKLLLENQPEFALLLSWHYAKEIITALRNKGLRSKIIIPLPQIIIDEV